MDMNSSEYEQAENWYNSTSKAAMIEYATSRGLDIGQDNEQLNDDWNEAVIKEKYLELGGK